MKIHFDPKDFLRQFKIAASVVPTRDVKPILCNVKIVADKRGGVVLMATDTDVGIRIRVDADVSKDGKALLPPKQFKQILASAKDGRLTLESTKTAFSSRGNTMGMSIGNLPRNPLMYFLPLTNSRKLPITRFRQVRSPK